MTPNGNKTISWRNGKHMKLKMKNPKDTNKLNLVKQWFQWPAESQQLNDLALKAILENLVLKLLRDRPVWNDI